MTSDLGSLADAHPDYIADVARSSGPNVTKRGTTDWMIQRRASLFGVSMVCSIATLHAQPTVLATIAVVHALAAFVVWRSDVTLSRVLVVCHVAAVGVTWHDRWLRRFGYLFPGFRVLPLFAPVDELLQAPFVSYLGAATALTQIAFVARGNRDRLWLRVLTTGPLLAMLTFQQLRAADAAGQYFLRATFYNSFLWPRLVAWCAIGVSAIWWGAAASRAAGLDLLRVGLLWAIFNYLVLWTAARWFGGAIPGIH